MIDFYEDMDFDRKVWVFDGGKAEQLVLRDVLHAHCDPDGKYKSEGCNLLEFRPNYQHPAKVIAEFDTEEEAEHAYLLWLLHDRTTTDNRPDIGWSAAQAADLFAATTEAIDHG